MKASRPVAAATLCLGLTLGLAPAFANDADPFGFEKEHFLTSRARAEVLDELRAARSKGELPAGEIGLRFADPPSVKTRSQVAAETREAARLGVLRHGVDGPPRLTAEQVRRIEEAGSRARAAIDMADEADRP